MSKKKIATQPCVMEVDRNDAKFPTLRLHLVNTYSRTRVY